MNKSTILYLPTNRSYHAALPAALILACAMLPASGVTETDYSNNSGYQANVPATSANLLAAPGTTLALSGGAPAMPDGREGTSTSWATLVDGSFGAGNPDRVAIADDWTLTYTFADSYVITSIDTFSAWNDDGRVQQDYTVSYATAADPGTFIPIKTVAYHPGGVSNTWVHMADLGGINAKAIQFAFGPQQNGHVGYPELAVQGTLPVLAVSLTAPNDNQALSSSGPVTASASVADFGTPPYTVGFFLKTGGGGFVSAGSADHSPYQVSLGTLAAGIYQIYATVTDSATPSAGTATSATHTFTVGDLPPTVTLTSPADKASFVPGADIVIEATAADDYAVARVEFYADGNLLESDVSPPYACTWVGAAAGAHTLTAVATDSADQTVTSPALSVRVAVPPLVINLAPVGNAVRDGGGGMGSLNNLDNGDGNGINHCGIRWSTVQNVNALYLQTDGVLGDFDFQVAKPGVTNPDIDNDADWTTPAGWSISGNTSTHPLVSVDAALETHGVRVKPAAGGFSAIELMVLGNVTTNAVATATVGGYDNWTTWGSAPMSRLWDGDFFRDDQAGIEDTAPPPLTYDWTSPQTIAGVMISGGAGSFPTAYDVEYQDGEGGWQTAVSVADNAGSISCCGFAPVTSQHFRVKLNGTSDNQYQRISDIMLFNAAVVPPSPGFAGWIGTGGYGLTGNDAAANADPDHDGLDNAVEYVLGSSPIAANAGGPECPGDDKDLVFTFQRAISSKTADTTVDIEVGTDLANWPDVYRVGTDTASSTYPVTVTAGLQPGFETVTLRVARAPHAARFARMMVTVSP